jgi:hypothetical protein
VPSLLVVPLLASFIFFLLKYVFCHGNNKRAQKTDEKRQNLMEKVGYKKAPEKYRQVKINSSCAAHFFIFISRTPSKTASSSIELQASERVSEIHVSQFAKHKFHYPHSQFGFISSNQLQSDSAVGVCEHK